MDKPVIVVIFVFPSMTEREIAKVLASLVLRTYKPGPNGLSESEIFGWPCSADLLVSIFYDILMNRTHESRWWRWLRKTKVVSRDDRLELREKVVVDDDDANHNNPGPSYLEQQHNAILAQLGNSIVFGGPITFNQLYRQLLEGDAIDVQPGNMQCQWVQAEQRFRFSPISFTVRREKTPEQAQEELIDLYQNGDSILDVVRLARTNLR